MAAKVVCVANNKGGVGKTTVTIALSEALANIRKGPVLIIDLDSQINASIVLSGNTALQNVPWNNGKSIMDYFDGTASGTQVPPHTYVSPTRLGAPDRRSDVSYVAGHPGMIWFERKRLSVGNQSLPQVQGWFLAQMDRLLASLSTNYEYIFFDCPPGLSIATEAALTRADRILLPVVPTALSVMGLQGYASFLRQIRQDGQAGILKTMVSNNNAMNLWSADIDQLRNDYYVFNGVFRHSAAWANAMDREDGHRAYPATYGPVAAQLDSVVHEFLLW